MDADEEDGGEEMGPGWMGWMGWGRDAVVDFNREWTRMDANEEGMTVDLGGDCDGMDGIDHGWRGWRG